MRDDDDHDLKHHFEDHPILDSLLAIAVVVILLFAIYFFTMVFMELFR